jgi:hypothetical protein
LKEKESNMKKYLGLLIIGILLLVGCIAPTAYPTPLLSAPAASQPLSAGDETWQNVFKLIIMAVVAIGGAPFTQLVKAGLTKLFKVVIEDRYALIVTGIVSAGFAVLEMWLSGVLNFGTITLDNFPNTFFAVFTVATVYYAWLKNSPSLLGFGGLLKKPQL